MVRTCPTKRNGKGGLGRKPIAKRTRRTLKAIRQKLRLRMHDDPLETGLWLGRVLNGWLNYYAVPTSSPSLTTFRYYLLRHWKRTLQRRSDKDRTNWDSLTRLYTQIWPPIRIRHPWPSTRFAVNTQAKSRMH